MAEGVVSLRISTLRHARLRAANRRGPSARACEASNNKTLMQKMEAYLRRLIQAAVMAIAMSRRTGFEPFAIDGREGKKRRQSLGGVNVHLLFRNVLAESEAVVAFTRVIDRRV